MLYILKRFDEAITVIDFAEDGTVNKFGRICCTRS